MISPGELVNDAAEPLDYPVATFKAYQAVQRGRTRRPGAPRKTPRPSAQPRSSAASLWRTAATPSAQSRDTHKRARRRLPLPQTRWRPGRHGSAGGSQPTAGSRPTGVARGPQGRFLRPARLPPGARSSSRGEVRRPRGQGGGHRAARQSPRSPAERLAQARKAGQHEAESDGGMPSCIRTPEVRFLGGCHVSALRFRSEHQRSRARDERPTVCS